MFGLLLVAIYVAGFVTARLAQPSLADATTSFSDQYPLLSATLMGPNSNDILINFVSLHSQLATEFNTLPAGTTQSFYFEYLPDGTNIRIGADNFLVAASLIKVPLVMNLYRAAELNKINLNQMVTVTQSELDPGYGNLYQKGAGYQLTLRQAAQMALEQSDDTATHVIFDHVGNRRSRYAPRGNQSEKNSCQKSRSAREGQNGAVQLRRETRDARGHHFWGQNVH